MTKIEYEAGKKIKTMKANIWIRNPQKSIKSMKANSFDHADITNSLSEENVINAESCTSCIPDILGRLKNEEMPKRATVRRSLSANEGSCHAVHSNVLPFNHHAHQKSHERKPVASCLKHTDDRSDIYFDFSNKFDLPKNCKYLVEGQSISSRAQVVVNRDSICEDSASTVDDESPLLRNKCVNRATFDNFAINALDVIDRQAGAESTSESLFDNLSINEELDEPIRISKMSKLTQKKQKQAELKLVIPKNHLFNIKPLSASASREMEEVLQLVNSFSQIGNGNKSMVSAPCTPGGSSSKESLSGSNDSPPGGHTWFGGLRKKKEQKKTFLDEFNQQGQRNLQSSEVETYKELVDKNVCIKQGAHFSNANVGHHCMPGSRSTRQHSSLSESDRSPSALHDRTINSKKVLKYCVSSHSDGSDGNSCEVTSWHSNSSEIRSPVQRSKSISSEGKVEVIQRRLVKIPQSLSFELVTMTSESNIGMMTTSSRSLPTPTLDLPPPLPEKMGSRSSLFRSDSPPLYPAPTPPQRANTHSPQQSLLQPPELPPPVLKPRMPKRTLTEKLKPHPPLARFHSAGEDTILSRTFNHRSNTSRREVAPRLTPDNDNRYQFRPAGMNCNARLRSSCGSDLVNSSLESMDTAGESTDQRNSRLNARDLGIDNKTDLFWAKDINFEVLQRLTEAEIQREVFTPIPGRYETSDSVSYEDLSDFSCSQSNVHSQSDQLEQVCDEIRLMMKVFANTVSVNDCETALSETYWNVHDAIKYIKLKCLLEDVSGLADEQQCKQALMFCKWDTHEAASYLQMPPHERYLPNIMGI